jgi:hypothetical protein
MDPPLSSMKTGVVLALAEATVSVAARWTVPWLSKDTVRMFGGDGEVSVGT